MNEQTLQGPTHASFRPQQLARVFVLLSLYQWFANPQLTAEKLEVALRDLIEEPSESTFEEIEIPSAAEFAKCDHALMRQLLQGVLKTAPEMTPWIEKSVDRDLKRVSLVERAILFLGTYEIMHRPEVPYAVILNECVELAKTFGSGYRFTNAVLERLARELRPDEVKAYHDKKHAHASDA